MNLKFTRASEVDHVATAISLASNPEDRGGLGARLFDRRPRCAKLTVFGKAFLPKAERILRELDGSASWTKPGRSFST
jgi:hypothetical protein